MTMITLDASATLETQSPGPSFPTLDLAGAIAQVKNWSVAVGGTSQKTRDGQATYTSLAQASDVELMTAIALGVEEALERLYERYARLSYVLAYRLLRDSAAAEDIVQEAFLAIWRKAGTYQAQHGSVYSWLQAIVHHRAIDKLRSAANRDLLCAPLEPAVEQQTLSAEQDACDQVWQGEQRRMVLAALAHIPLEQRQVIDMAYFGGYTHVEIAEMLHIPLGTVKGRMRLGLQKMKSLLDESGINEE